MTPHKALCLVVPAIFKCRFRNQHRSAQNNHCVLLTWSSLKMNRSRGESRRSAMLPADHQKTRIASTEYFSSEIGLTVDDTATHVLQERKPARSASQGWGTSRAIWKNKMKEEKYALRREKEKKREDRKMGAHEKKRGRKKDTRGDRGLRRRREKHDGKQSVRTPVATGRCRAR